MIHSIGFTDVSIRYTRFSDGVDCAIMKLSKGNDIERYRLYQVRWEWISMTMKKVLGCAAVAAIWSMVVLLNIHAADARLSKTAVTAPFDQYVVQMSTSSYVNPHSPDYQDIVLEQDGIDR